MTGDAISVHGGASPDPSRLASASARTALPCPEWCDEPAGHRYELLDEHAVQCRYHSKTFGDTDEDVIVEAAAMGTWRPGAEEVAEPLISVWIGGESALEDLSVEHARELGSQLLVAVAWAQSAQNPT